MIALEDGDDVRAIVTPELRLAFRWSGDRWIHAIEVRVGGDWATFVQSIEADAERDDPRRVVSPTYQELFLRAGEETDLDTGDPLPQALLVGRFGNHHFSAVFSVDGGRVAHTDRWQRRSLVRVNIADRCPAGLDSLAASYLVSTWAGLPKTSRGLVANWILPGGEVEAEFAMSDFARTSGRLALTEARPPWSVMAQAQARLLPGEPTQSCEYSWLLGVRKSAERPGERALFVPSDLSDRLAQED